MSTTDTLPKSGGGVVLQRLVRGHLSATLYLGDCLTLPRIEADAVISDPPYGIKLQTRNSTRGNTPPKSMTKLKDPGRWSDLLDRAYRILKARGEMRGSDLGWELWGETTAVPGRGTGSQRHNKFCRPAGKVLRALERQHRVRSVGREACTAWKAV